MKTNLRRSLLGSIVSLLICFTMLLGTTFAWFTDSVTSVGNKIISGTLDVELYQYVQDSEGAWSWNNITEDSDPLFEYDLWEPGYTEYVVLKVVNEGNLALKWKATFTSTTALSELAEVINVYVNPTTPVETGTSVINAPANRDAALAYTPAGTLAEFIANLETVTVGELGANEEACLTIVLQMDPLAGNAYQDLDLGGAFDISIVATQNTVESDAFGTDYDEKAEFPTTTTPVIPDEGETHEHSYSSDWVWDDVYHWHVCTADEYCDILDSFAEHSYEEGSDNCAVCGRLNDVNEPETPEVPETPEESDETVVYTRELSRSVAKWGTYLFEQDSSFLTAINNEEATLYLVVDGVLVDDYIAVTILENGTDYNANRVVTGTVVESSDTATLISFDAYELYTKYVADNGTADWKLQLGLNLSEAPNATITSAYVTVPASSDGGEGKAHTHNTDWAQNIDGTTHTSYCDTDNCDGTFVPSVGDCSDGDGDGKCDLCEGTVASACTHELGARIYSWDDDAHWINCIVCKEKVEYAEHDDTEEPYHRCDTCGGETSTCTYAVASNDSGNTHTVTVCDICSLGSDVSEYCSDGDDDGNCDLCGGTIQMIFSATSTTVGEHNVRFASNVRISAEVYPTVTVIVSGTVTLTEGSTTGQFRVFPAKAGATGAGAAAKITENTYINVTAEEGTSIANVTYVTQFAIDYNTDGVVLKGFGSTIESADLTISIFKGTETEYETYLDTLN